MTNRKDHYFIYLKDKNGNRTGHTICVIIRDNMIFHGITICSASEQFNKKVARQLSFERALQQYNRYLVRCSEGALCT